MGERHRARWAAIGAAIAVSLGAGGLGLVHADIGSGPKPVTITVTPRRVLDTRSGLGLVGAFTDGAPRELVVVGDVAVAPSGTATVVPVDATGVLVNITVVGPSSAGFLSLRPGGTVDPPTSSTVNFSSAGGVFPNAATVALGPGGTVQIWLDTAAAGGSAEVLIDIVGYTVDHNHDDRYYTKAQVDAAVAPLQAIIDAPLVLTTSGADFVAEGYPIGSAPVPNRTGVGCTFLPGGNSTFLFGAITVPTGYRVVSFKGLLFDNWAGGNGTLQLLRVAANGTTAQLAQVTSSGASLNLQAVSADASTGDLSIVNPGTFLVGRYFGPPGNPDESNQVCGMELTLERV